MTELKHKPLTYEAYHKFIDIRFLELMKTYRKDKETIGPKDAKTTVELCQFKDHYFIYERTPFTYD